MLDHDFQGHCRQSKRTSARTACAQRGKACALVLQRFGVAARCCYAFGGAAFVRLLVEASTLSECPPAAPFVGVTRYNFAWRPIWEGSMIAVANNSDTQTPTAWRTTVMLVIGLSILCYFLTLLTISAAAAIATTFALSALHAL